MKCAVKKLIKVGDFIKCWLKEGSKISSKLLKGNELDDISLKNKSRARGSSARKK